MAALLASGIASAAEPGPVDARLQAASLEIQQTARWVGESGDNAGMPYALIDKVNARVFVFDATGHLRGTAAALLGMARGDGRIAGIGKQKMSAIRPAERTTPAGRFEVSLDHDIHGQEVLLIDYANSIALHPVVKGTPAERRAQRLDSETSDDNRISYGCINVPLKFYREIVSPAFTRTNGIVYILPEKSKASTFFHTAAALPKGRRL
ncbi:MAG: L,D-transpeptidase [Betaproteobacteria bacterium]